MQNITANDPQKLMAIFKKLGLSIPKVIAAQTYLNSKKYTPEQKARKLFGIPEEEDMSSFFAARLTKEEVEIVRNAIGLHMQQERTDDDAVKQDDAQDDDSLDAFGGSNKE